MTLLNRFLLKIEIAVIFFTFFANCGSNNIRPRASRNYGSSIRLHHDQMPRYPQTRQHLVPARSNMYYRAPTYRFSPAFSPMMKSTNQQQQVPVFVTNNNNNNNNNNNGNNWLTSLGSQIRNPVVFTTNTNDNDNNRVLYSQPSPMRVAIQPPPEIFNMNPSNNGQQSQQLFKYVPASNFDVNNQQQIPFVGTAYQQAVPVQVQPQAQPHQVVTVPASNSYSMDFYNMEPQVAEPPLKPLSPSSAEIVVASTTPQPQCVEYRELFLSCCSDEAYDKRLKYCFEGKLYEMGWPYYRALLSTIRRKFHRYSTTTVPTTSTSSTTTTTQPPTTTSTSTSTSTTTMEMMNVKKFIEGRLYYETKMNGSSQITSPSPHDRNFSNLLAMLSNWVSYQHSPPADEENVNKEPAPERETTTSSMATSLMPTLLSETPRIYSTSQGGIYTLRCRDRKWQVADTLANFGCCGATLFDVRKVKCQIVSEQPLFISYLPASASKLARFPKMPVLMLPTSSKKQPVIPPPPSFSPTLTPLSKFVPSSDRLSREPMRELAEMMVNNNNKFSGEMQRFYQQAMTTTESLVLKNGVQLRGLPAIVGRENNIVKFKLLPAFVSNT